VNVPNSKLKRRRNAFVFYIRQSYKIREKLQNVLNSDAWMIFVAVTLYIQIHTYVPTIWHIKYVTHTSGE